MKSKKSAKSIIRFLPIIGIISILGCADNSPEFVSDRLVQTTGNVQMDQSTTRTVTKELNILKDSFSIASKENIVENRDVSNAPLKIETLNWEPSDLLENNLEVSASTQQTKTAAKKSPALVKNSASNEVLVLAIIDTSEDFARKSVGPSLRSRAIEGVQYLADRLGSSPKIKFGLCNLPGSGTSAIDYLSPTVGESIGDFKNRLATAMDNVFNRRANGTEQVFKGVADCYSLASGRGYLSNYPAVITLALTNAANCKNDGTLADDNLVCPNRTSISSIHNHKYFLTKSLSEQARQLTLFGALYQAQNHSSGICINGEAVETPNAGEILLDNSQYADAASISLAQLQLPSSNRIVGDLCNDSLDTVPLDNLANYALQIARSRIFVKYQPGDYSGSYANFNLSIDSQSSAQKLPAASYEIRPIAGGLKVAVVNDESIAGPYEATYYTVNSYDTLIFNILSPQPKDGSSVNVSWSYNGIPTTLACAQSNSNSFVSVPESDQCRWFGSTLAFRSVESFPVGTATLNFSASYSNNVSPVVTYTLSSAHPIIRSSVGLIDASGNSKLITTSVLTPANNATASIGTSVKLDFSSLAAGTYKIQWKESLARSFTLASPLTSPIASAKAFVCGDSEAEFRINALDQVELSSGNNVACSAAVSGPNSIVTMGAGLLSSTSNKVGYRVVVSNLPSFELSHIPDEATLKIEKWVLNSSEPVSLTSSQFSVSGRLIQFTPVIAPGEKIKISYETLPDLPKPTFVLSESSVDDSYKVSYGPKGNEKPLDEQYYEIAKVGTETTITLKMNLDLGYRLTVNYPILINENTKVNDE